jgi:Tfp pilus assembly protein PilN
MNFSINLATKVYADFRKVNLCFIISGVILTVWLVFSISTCVDNAAKIEKVSEFKAKLDKSADGKKVTDAEYTAFLADVKNVNFILYKRSYDWLALLANLEKLVPEGVALKRLEPADKGEILKLSASARNFSAVRQFIENLESSQVFSEIYLTDQTFVKEEGQKGLNFSVTCKVSAS